LIIGTTGFLIRSFIETIDEAAGENMEALKSTGAGIFPVITQSILPASLPGFIAWFLYCIETNIRASTILGMVGAGGIGLLMTGYIKQYNYHAASTVIIAIALIIIGVNLLTDYLRKRCGNEIIIKEEQLCNHSAQKLRRVHKYRYTVPAGAGRIRKIAVADCKTIAAVYFSAAAAVLLPLSSC
ncbi:MAG: PhnE/PtxC family ABC transporter permease, partial [Eisenbergiella sp.]